MNKKTSKLNSQLYSKTFSLNENEDY